MDDYIHQCGKAFDKARIIAVECRVGITQMIRDSPYLDEDDRERWISQTLSCHQNMAFALLGSILPCLKGIALTTSWDNMELLYSVWKINQGNRRKPGGSVTSL